jgi:hypothetical protein
LAKYTKKIGLTLLSALLLMAALSTSLLMVSAQTQGTVNIMDSVGGTTDPAAGTQTYNDGTTVTFTATPAAGYAFSNWIVSTDAGAGTDTSNPLSLPIAGGTTYTIQAIFTPIQVPPGGTPTTDYSHAAIVVVLTSAGGTTNPVPGTYALASAAALNLTAVPDSGWKFDHWVISGIEMSHGAYPFTPTPTDNPYNVNHGYGATYSYQAVFTPTTGVSPTPQVPEFPTTVAVLMSIGLIVVLIAVGAYSFKRKN